MMPFLRLAIRLTAASRTHPARTARCHQFVGGIPAVELADSERRSIDRRWRPDDRHTRAIGQACVEDGILAGQVLTQNPRNPLDGRLQPVRCCTEWRALSARRRPPRSAKTPVVPLIIKSDIDGSSKSARSSSGKNGSMSWKLIALLPRQAAEWRLDSCRLRPALPGPPTQDSRGTP